MSRFAALLPPGAEVLDLACGSGRHGRMLLDAGHRVCFLDRELEACADLSANPRAELCEADLEDGSPWPLDGRRFAAVVVTRYLWRPLFPAILAALAADGLLIYETFMQGHEAFGRPRNPDFLLRPGELVEICAGLDILAFEEGRFAGPQILQRICARNPQQPPGT